MARQSAKAYNRSIARAKFARDLPYIIGILILMVPVVGILYCAFIQAACGYSLF